MDTLVTQRTSDLTCSPIIKTEEEEESQSHNHMRLKNGTQKTKR